MKKVEVEKSSVTAGRGEVSVDSLIQVEEIDITAEDVKDGCHQKRRS